MPSSQTPLSLGKLLLAFPFLGAVAAGCPVEGSVVNMVCYPLWAVCVGGMWLGFFATRRSDLGDDPNRSHARHLMSCLATLSTIIWLIFVTAVSLTRIYFGQAPDRPIMFLAGWIGLFAPIGFVGTVFSLLLYFNLSDWRMMLLRGATVASTTLPLAWVVWETGS